MKTFMISDLRFAIGERGVDTNYTNSREERELQRGGGRRSAPSLPPELMRMYWCKHMISRRLSPFCVFFAPFLSHKGVDFSPVTKKPGNKKMRSAEFEARNGKGMFSAKPAPDVEGVREKDEPPRHGDTKKTAEGNCHRSTRRKQSRAAACKIRIRMKSMIRGFGTDLRGAGFSGFRGADDYNGNRWRLP
jgi:hypothetical protein